MYFFRLRNVSLDDSGELRCEVSTALDRLQSDAAILTVVKRTRIVEFAEDRDIIDLVQGRENNEMRILQDVQ